MRRLQCLLLFTYCCNSLLQSNAWSNLARLHVSDRIINRLLLSSSNNNFNENTIKRKAPNRRTQLRWIVQNVERLLENDTKAASDADELLDCLSALSQAKHQKDIVNIGRQMELLDLASFSPDVLERTAKACALTGLLPQALGIVEYLWSSTKSIPSEITQDAVCRALRKAGKLSQLEDLLSRWSSCGRDVRISTTSFNIFLGALCELSIQRNSSYMIQQSRWQLLDNAWSWLQAASCNIASIAADRLKIPPSWPEITATPDIVSFNTLLHAAADAGNQTLSDEIWHLLQDLSLEPDIVTLNARLRVLIKRERNSLSSPHNSAVLKLWQEIKKKGLKPDKYTVDLMLLPLVGAGRIGEVGEMLDDFVANNSDSTVSKGFEVFLLTLTQGGEWSVARSLLFDAYIAPALAPVLVGQAGTMRLVRPTTKQLNLLLEGYRQAAESARERTRIARADERVSSSNNETVDCPASAITTEAWELYDRLSESPLVQADSYTVTTMIGLTRDSNELTDLLQQAKNELDMEISSALLRAAMTMYGKHGDPSSTCWLFAQYVASSTRSLRSWNVLMGAIAHSVTPTSGNGKLCIWNATVARLEVGRVMPYHSAFVNLIDGRTSTEVLQMLLRLMSSGNERIGQLDLPLPDSQTFCIVASSLQYHCNESSIPMEMFRNASALGIPADGRFVNAILRCFGNDVKGAIHAWKTELRTPCLKHEHRLRTVPPSIFRAKGKNLIAAYNGLIHVCGRALRPDLALRVDMP